MKSVILKLVEKASPVKQEKRFEDLWGPQTWNSDGADSGNRTCDLFITSELLYQLSHVGASNNIDIPPRFIKKKRFLRGLSSVLASPA